MSRYTKALAEMSAEGLAKTGSLKVYINGSSMLPSLRPGDYVLVEACQAGSLRPGEILVARREADLVTHRLLGQAAQGWLLKGDASALADEPIPAEAILGRVVALVRDGKQISLDRTDWQSASRRLFWLSRVEYRLGLVARQVFERLYPGVRPAWLDGAAQKTKRVFSWLANLLAPRFK